MGDGPDRDTGEPQAERPQETSQSQQTSSTAAWRILAVVGFAALSAGVAYALIRAATQRSTPDPTGERIQALIDEANRLLKTLDDQKKA
jgi:anti-sigma-K factor RskA